MGRLLGSISRVESEALKVKIGRSAVNRKMALALIQADKQDCALTSDPNVQLLHNVFLTTPSASLRPGPARAPFFLLRYLFVPVYFSFRYPPRFAYEAITSFKSEPLSDDQVALVSAHPLIRQCYELSLELSNSYSDATTSAQQLNAFESVLEKCIQKWGARPAIVSALLDSVAQRRIKISEAAFDFFDEKYSVTQRLRAAKARAASKDWWAETLDKAANTRKSVKLLLLESLIVFCSRETMLHNEPKLSTILDDLSDAEWITLMSVISGRPRMRGKAEGHSEMHSDSNSIRYSFLFALTHGEKSAQQVFMRTFRNYDGKNERYLWFKQTQAVAAAAAGLLDWNEALKIVQEIYASGFLAPDFDYVARNTTNLPANIASVILSNPQIYPVAMFDAAEASASRQARKGIRPLQSIAKSEQWFLQS